MQNPSAYEDDSQLIQACLRKDEAAWKELVQRYSRLVYSIAIRYHPMPSDADDVFQNVFVIVYRRLETLRDQRRLAAWLISITHHECQRLRSRRPKQEELADSMPDGQTLPLDEMELLEQRHLIRRALDQLEPPCRDLLMAFFLESEKPSYQEISQRFQIPVGSIGPTRTRCFKKLEAILKKMGVDEG